jgi:SAM-dependent methyltransferase
MTKDEKEASKKYGIVAEHYHNWRTKIHPEGWIFNEFLEMPATFELLGDIKGKKILDVGCGAGIYTKEMRKRGAIVKGFDITPEMLEIAKKENPGLDLRLGSAYKIPFKEKFDVVIAPLVISHLENWDKVFKQVYRVLKKDGYFVFSNGNPITEITWKFSKKDPLVRRFDNYFQEMKNYGNWKNILHKKQVKNVKMPFYHKTYEKIIRLILKNGFEIVDYKDCFPEKKAEKLFPKEYDFLSKVPFFCVWKVRRK